MKRSPIFLRRRFGNGFAEFGLALVLATALFFATRVSAEIVFQDFFRQPATNLTNSVPWIDVQGNGWRTGASPSQLALDGSGHVYNSAIGAGTAAGVPLIPIGPHGSMTALALVTLPAGSTEWTGIGFAISNLFLSANPSGSGPWLQVQGNGNITLYGGVGLNNAATVVNAFTNSGNPVQVFLTYDAYQGTATAGTINGAETNWVFNQWPLTNSAGLIAPHYFVLQMSTNLTTPTARWATAVAVDWIPRPPPMLTLPVTIQRTNFVGLPGPNDEVLISSALNSVGNFAGGTEIRFAADATYVISNELTTAHIPLALVRATNVLVNGNGCKILIRNPHAGFLSVNNSSNIIVEGFSVDYDPLPFTQGVVTHNFSNDPSNEAAIEFAVDTGYPAPTNENYLDTNASRWGMVIDPTRPGRVANGAWTQVFYTNVVQTNVDGAFKVSLTASNRAQSISPGSHWCMISRWDGAIVFNTSLSTRVTYLNNTNYTGAGPSYVGERSTMTCEINDWILPGPPPAGTNAPRLRASNADGGMFIDSRIGPWVQGCSFTGLSDDAANACLGPFVITNVPVQPTNTFAAFINSGQGGTPAAVDAFRAAVGDVVDFYNATDGEVFDRATITAVSLPNITFDHSISNVVAGTYDTNTLLLDETLNTSAVYLDNQFSDSAFHGIYCRANNMLIAHNTVGGMGKNAIGAFPAITSNFLNFFVPTNVVIMDNVLFDEGFSHEALKNSIPNEQPAYAMIALLKADKDSDSVTAGFEISGIRILYNAFLNWRRAPVTLHNATDVNVIGNYFGPPVTNDNLVPLANDVIADLWASDYPNLRFMSNVNATAIANVKSVNEDGTNAPIANAFQLLLAPTLTVNLAGSNVLVTWVSPSPGFVLQQQIDKLNGGTAGWLDVTNATLFAGQSNLVTAPLANDITNQFYRARQR